jgi:2-polyprenyl-3-methyl-5-hydroxy-6-metoxy-1,4-benzoquinol methylase
MNLGSCISCKSEELEQIQKIKTSDINELYKRAFSYDVIDEFKGENHINYVKCKQCSLHFFTPILPGSGRFYEELQKRMSFYYKDNRYEFFYSKDFIKEGDKVLEIGSGNGHFSEIINAKDYTGLEYNDKAIKDAAEKGIRLIKQSIEDHSKEQKEVYDVVCSFQVLEHVPNPHEYIQASLRVLKKGGLMIIGVPAMESILTTNLNHTLNLPPHHMTRWNKEAFQYFEQIFDVKLHAFSYEPLPKNMEKNYTRRKLQTKIHRSLLGQKKKIVNTKKSIFFADMLVNKYIEKFSVRSVDEDAKGESIIAIFRKV